MYASPLFTAPTLSYDALGPFLIFNVSVSTLYIPVVYLELLDDCVPLPFTYAFISARNLLNPLGLQPTPQKLVPGQVLADLLESYLPK